MPVVQFPGRVHVIESASAARDAVTFLMKQPYIGFDTETRPSFHKGEVHNVALVQLSTLDECFLFRINIIGFTNHLRQLLEDKNIIKIGLSTKDDFHGLNRLAEFTPGGFIELQNYVRKFDITDMSLQKIYAIIFGGHISKGQRLTNWEARQLTPLQQGYAALDAWACLKIYQHLENGLFDPATSIYRTEG